MSLMHYRRGLRYDDWANREVLRTLQRESSPPASCGVWFAHVLGAQFEWLARLRGTRSELVVWPAVTLDELEPYLGRLREDWLEYLGGLGSNDLGRLIAYSNSKGQPWRSRVEDVLEHVLLHGAHHRGQIASALREAGLTPPYLDFIHATRNGWLE